MAIEDKEIESYIENDISDVDIYDKDIVVKLSVDQ